jgi:hypothetical protein
VLSYLTKPSVGVALVVLGLAAVRAAKELIAIAISLRGSKPSERATILVALASVLRSRHGQHSRGLPHSKELPSNHDPMPRASDGKQPSPTASRPGP